MFDYDFKHDWQADDESAWEPRPIVRDASNHGDGSERLSLPWVKLTLLIVPIGAVLLAFGPLIAAGVVLIAAAALVGRWGWRVVSSYSRKQGRD